MAPRALAMLYRLAREARRVRAEVRALVQRDAADDDGWIARLVAAGLPIDDVASEVSHLYWAYDAIDYVLTAAVVELSRHPGERAALRAEWAAALAPDAAPTLADAPKLPRTTRVMREVLRLYPVSMGVARHTGEALDAGGVRLPAGTEVLILLHPLHRDPEWWSDPETFDPSRWEGATPPHPPFAYVPFLEGPRRCVGQHLAELEFAVVLHALLRAWDVDVLAPAPRATRFRVPRFEGTLPFVTRRAP